MYAVRDSQSDDTAGPSTSRPELLEARGSVRRRAQDRAALVRYDASGSLLLCQSAGKQVEIYKVRSIEESKKKMRRRKKRKREKQNKVRGSV